LFLAGEVTIRQPHVWESGASRGRMLLVGSGPHRAVLQQHDDELTMVTNVKAAQAGNDTGFLVLIRGAVEDSE
jgi:hypothetical protein